MLPYSSLSDEKLLLRCIQTDDTAAWEEFIRRFHRLIAKVVLRTCIRWGTFSNETVDDLIQETYLKLSADRCRLLREFESRHPNSFMGYLQMVAANLAKDHFKAIHSQTRGSCQVEQMPEDFIAIAHDNSAGSPQMIERDVLIEEIARHVEDCVKGPDAERNRKIFWLRFQAGLSAAKIAALPDINLTEKGVESLIFRILNDVRDRMVAPVQQRPGILTKADKGFMSTESF